MKKAIVGSLCLLISSLSWAEENVNIPALCTTIGVMDEVLDKYDELPLVRGKSVREGSAGTVENSLVVFMNAKTGTWTLIERTGERYCVLAVGNSMQPVPASVIDTIVNNRQKKRS